VNDQVLATYRLHGESAAAVGRAAEKFATGQSVGTWLPLPGLTTDLVKRHGAHVGELSAVSDEAHAYEAVIAFPTENFEIGFPMLWTTLLGNDPSTGIEGEQIGRAHV